MTDEKARWLYGRLVSRFTPGEEFALSAIGAFFKEKRNDIDYKNDLGFAKLIDLAVDMEARGYLSIRRADDTVHTPYFTLREPEEGEVVVLPFAVTTPKPAVQELSDDLLIRVSRRYLNDHDLSLLPDSMTYDTVFATPTCMRVLSNSLGMEYTIRELDADYQIAKAADLVVYHADRDQYYFPIFHPEKNVNLLVAALNHTPSFPAPWRLAYAGYDSFDIYTSDPKDQLKNWANIGRELDFLKTLADEAIEENWQFDATDAPYAVLRNYISYTFYYLYRQSLKEEGTGILEGQDDKGEFAAFNTGLQYRRNGNDLFAFFTKQVRYNAGTSPWKFIGFCCADHYDPAARGLYTRLTKAFAELPKAAEYFQSIDDLLFDPDAQLELASSHIGIDNCNRLPMKVLLDVCEEDPAAMQTLSEIKEAAETGRSTYALYTQLREQMEQNYGIGHRMEEKLSGAVDRAMARVRRNYRLAVPCYHVLYNSMSLMLPISFSYDLAPKQPDAVLICSKNADGNYAGRTILTLKMAYTDARLLCRPDSEWLSSPLSAPPVPVVSTPAEPVAEEPAETLPMDDMDAYMLMQQTTDLIETLRHGTIRVSECRAEKSSEGADLAVVHLIYENPAAEELVLRYEDLSLKAGPGVNRFFQNNKPCWNLNTAGDGEYAQIALGKTTEWEQKVELAEAGTALTVELSLGIEAQIGSYCLPLVHTALNTMVELPQDFDYRPAAPADSAVLAHDGSAAEYWPWAPCTEEDHHAQLELEQLLSGITVEYLSESVVYKADEAAAVCVRYRLTNTALRHPVAFNNAITYEARQNGVELYDYADSDYDDSDSHLYTAVGMGESVEVTLAMGLQSTTDPVELTLTVDLPYKQLCLRPRTPLNTRTVSL